MFDGILSRTDHLPHRQTEEQASTPPWQFFAVLTGLAILSAIAAMLYPDVFAAPFEQF